MNTMDNLTIDNFTAKTGFRFRVSHIQAARIALTNLGNDRQKMIGASLDEAATLLDARNPDGGPLNWVKTAVKFMEDGWNDQLTLTREQAFTEFLADGGLENLQGKNRPDVPDSVYLEDGLTIDNFEDRVKAAIGTVRRFRVSREQAQRIKDGSLTREQALQEVITAKRATVSA